MERRPSFSTPAPPNGNGHGAHPQYSSTPSVISTSATSGFGSSGKFVRRLEALERDNIQLKAKVESLQVWQTVVQNWMMENFGVQYTESIASEESNTERLKYENSQYMNGDEGGDDSHSESERETPSDSRFNNRGGSTDSRPIEQRTSMNKNKNNKEDSRNGNSDQESDSLSTNTSLITPLPRSPHKNKSVVNNTAVADSPGKGKDKKIEKNTSKEKSPVLTTRATLSPKSKSTPDSPRKNKIIEKSTRDESAIVSTSVAASSPKPKSISGSPQKTGNIEKKAQNEKPTIDSDSRNGTVTIAKTVRTAAALTSQSQPSEIVDDQLPSSTPPEEAEWGIIENVYTEEQKPRSPESGPVDETPCDVCRSIYPEDNNLMVFCDGDGCNICVHQACYGIPELPVGVWKCRTCTKGIPPNTQDCLFCTKKGGAMTPCKSPSGRSWAHVACALWIPEVTFGKPDQMEPVIQIPQIPKKRWQLICSICSIKKGAPIQCYHGKCQTAFHVTCAYEKELRMDMDDDSPDGQVQMAAYCSTHVNSQHLKSPPPKRRKTQSDGRK